MPIETILTMVGALGIVWGGLIIVLATALRKERAKGKEDDA